MARGCTGDHDRLLMNLMHIVSSEKDSHIFRDMEKNQWSAYAHRLL